MLVYVEEMQQQQRAENGIKEIVLGYIGHENENLGDEQVEEVIDVFEFTADFDGPKYEVAIDDLPEDVRSVLLAENHRIKTGEILHAKDFRRDGKN